MYHNNTPEPAQGELRVAFVVAAAAAVFFFTSTVTVVVIDSAIVMSHPLIVHLFSVQL